MGDKCRLLTMAVRALDCGGCRVVATSPVVMTPPFGGVARSPFLNAVVLVETALPPIELLDRCGQIEVRLGRRPARRWADRPIDIDVLLYGSRQLAHPRLELPHPRMVERPFQVALLARIWREARHPGSGVRYVDVMPTRLDAPIVATLPMPTRPDAAARVG